MKKFLREQLCLLVLVSIMVSIFNVQIYAAEEEETYTLMVYLNGTSLESDDSYASKDLSEMLNAKISDNVNVLVYTGGTAEWHSEQFGLPNIKENQNQLWQVTDEEMVLVKEYANLNIGTASTLQGFITDSVELYPADNYGIILWNHGGGPVWGFGQDDNHYYDSLTVVELEQSFRNAKAQTNVVFDFIGFDACLMNTIEFANALSDYGKTLIGSEEYSPATGWDYSSFLTELSEMQSFNNIEVGKSIVNTYYEFSKKEDDLDGVTMSVIDLGRIDDLMISFDNLFKAINEDISHNVHVEEVVKARIYAESFGEFAYGSGGFDVVDLYDFVRRLEDVYPEAKELLTKIDASVIYNLNGAENSRAKGLGVYIPDTYFRYISHAINTYNSMGFSREFQLFISVYTSIINSKTEMIKEYANDGDPYKYPKNESLNDVYELKTDEESRKTSSSQVIDNQNGEFQFLAESEVANTTYVICELGYKDEDDVIILGDKMILPSVEEGGFQTFVNTIPTEWVHLDGHLVTASYYSRNPVTNSYFYYIPLYINDEYNNLYFEIDKDTDECDILGYSSDFSKDTLQELKRSDRIGTLFLTYPLTRFGYDDYDAILNEEFTIWNLEITAEPIKADELVLHFAVGGGTNPIEESNFFICDFEEVSEYDTRLFGDYLTEIGPLVPECLDAGDDMGSDNQAGSDDTEHQTGITSCYDYFAFIDESNLEAYDYNLLLDLTDKVDGATSWSYGYINTANYYDMLIDGIDGRYTESITREEFCELVIKLMEHYGEIEVTSEENPFEDTENSAVKKAYYLGIVDGYGNGKFGPNDLITREQLVTMFFRALCILEVVEGMSVVDYVCEFDDLSSVSVWALESVEYFAGSNIVGGVGHNLFAPKANATIEQAIKVLIETFCHYDINR